MLLKLRPYNGPTEVIVEVTKSGLASTLFAAACDAFEVDAKNIDLFFAGQKLIADTPLLVYNLKDNDVIGVRLKNNNDASPVKNEEKKEVEVSTDEAETIATSISCKYFEAGDNLYYQDLANGQWYEATLVSVKKIESENTSPNQMDELLYTVHDGARNIEKILPLSMLRPCGSAEYSAACLKSGFEVLAYTSFPGGKFGWYQVQITSVTPGRYDEPKVIGTIVISADRTYPKVHIQFCNNTIKYPILIPRTEWIKMDSYLAMTTPCTKCKNHPSRKCKDCSCVKCGGKHDEDSQVLCDECGDAYHMACVDPPLETLPTEDWFCPDCAHVDKEAEKKIKETRKRKIEKAKESVTKAVKGKRDWGQGTSTASVADRFSVVPKEHFGKIPGVPSGRLWETRLDVCSYGVHRPPVAGICGTIGIGVQSVCFSGGYEGDRDDGNEFIMSGSGGRDLSNNKRTNKQSCDQTLTSTNLALAQSCHAMVNEDGASSADWRKGLPIRVVRGYKLSKISEFAPTVGYRYDGIYKVKNYYKDKNDEGFNTWRFVFGRDDIEPPPWSSAGVTFMRELNVGFLEISKAKKEALEAKNEYPKKKKWCKIEEAQPSLPIVTVPYVLKPEVAKLSQLDLLNQRNWEAAAESLVLGYPDYIKAIAETFRCIFCQEVAKDPYTPACGHNTCMSCIKKWMKDSSSQCPSCHETIEEKPEVNKILDKALNLLLPDYNRKQPYPKPYCLVKK